MIWISYLCLCIGLAFSFFGVMALHRFPDVYTRLQGMTNCTAFGAMFIYGAAIVYGVLMSMEGQGHYLILSMHTVIVALVVLITSPTGSHAISRGVYKHGIKPKVAVIDEFGGAE